MLELQTSLSTLEGEPEINRTTPAGKRIRRRRKHQKKSKTSDKNSDEAAASDDEDATIEENLELMITT